MEPVNREERTAFFNGPKVSVASVDDEPILDDTYNEDGDMSFVDDEAPSPEEVDDAKKEANKMTDEEIKIKALNQAVNIAKLMSDVTTDDVIKIAGKVAKFIKG